MKDRHDMYFFPVKLDDQDESNAPHIGAAEAKENNIPRNFILIIYTASSWVWTTASRRSLKISRYQARLVYCVFFLWFTAGNRVMSFFYKIA